MSQAAGYILILRRDRARLFEERVQEDDSRFAEAVPDFDHSRNAPLVCFISVEPGQITHIAQGSRGAKAGTDQRRLNLTEVKRVEGSLPFPAIHGEIPPEV